MKILIVDDSPFMRMFLKNLLSEYAPDIREAEDGETALLCFEAFHPDVVLMDIRMPGMDGIETTERILQRDQRARVIVVTEHNSPSYRANAMRAGAERFFLKDDLMELGRYLNRGMTDAGRN